MGHYIYNIIIAGILFKKLCQKEKARFRVLDIPIDALNLTFFVWGYIVLVSVNPNYYYEHYDYWHMIDLLTNLGHRLFTAYPMSVRNQPTLGANFFATPPKRCRRTMIPRPV